MDKGEDTGDIIYQKRITINSGEKLDKVNRKLSFTGAKLISKMLKNLEAGDVPRIKQPISTPTVRARKIKPEEYPGLIRWSEWDVEKVFHFLNGDFKVSFYSVEEKQILQISFQDSTS